jgi:hypothetical protein
MIWWLSKCVWVIATVLAFYGIGAVVAGGFSVLSGDFFSSPNEQSVLLISGLDISDLDSSTLLTVLMIPPLVSIALSLAQVSLSFIVGSLVSIIALLCYAITSVYYFTPVLIADYSMLLRNALFYPEGTQTMVAVTVSVIVAIVAILAGIFRITRIDIIRS